MTDTADVRFDFAIAKSSPTGRFVTGWLSVVQKDGKPVRDTQGDEIPIEEISKAFRAFMKGARTVKEDHAGDGVGELVEMLVIDDDVASALGITDTKRGVFGTAEITDETAQERVRKGQLKSFSIGGKGKRTPITKMSPDISEVHAPVPLAERTMPKPRSTKKPIGGGRVRFTLSRKRQQSR